MRWLNPLRAVPERDGQLFVKCGMLASPTGLVLGLAMAFFVAFLFLPLSSPADVAVFGLLGSFALALWNRPLLVIGPDSVFVRNVFSSATFDPAEPGLVLVLPDRRASLIWGEFRAQIRVNGRLVKNVTAVAFDSTGAVHLGAWADTLPTMMAELCPKLTVEVARS